MAIVVNDDGDCLQQGQTSAQPGYGKERPRLAAELKRFVNGCNVEPLRDLAATGFPEPCPPICFFTDSNGIPTLKRAGDRHMENKPAQNIQDTFLNTVRKDKTPITIYLVSGVKLTG